MKIPKDLHRRLSELEVELPKLFDHTVALNFNTENKAAYCSVDGRDNEIYFVLRKEDELQSDFCKRAEADMRLKFPNCREIIVPYGETFEAAPEDETNNLHRQSETSCRYIEKIRANIKVRQALRAAQNK